MKPVINHSWNISEKEAFEIQKGLAKKVISLDQFDEIDFVAGVDVAYSKESKKLVAAVVVIDANTLEVVESVSAEDKEQFPYVPSLFSFRELPPLIKAFEKLTKKPDLIVCDGQGYAHPRRFGLGCHLGILFDIPTIGCGKNRLVGNYGNLERERGAIAPLVDNGEVIGNVLRTQTDIKPVYVSIGHQISLATACEWILKLSPEYRLPETTRKADHLVKLKLKACQSSGEP